MPHDVNGNELKVGDKVNIPCTILTVQSGQDYCNVNVETEYCMFPGEHKSGFSVNAKQVIKIFTEGDPT